MTKANDILTSMEAQQDEFDAVMEKSIKVPAKVAGPAAAVVGGGALYGLHKLASRNKDKAGDAADKLKKVIDKTPLKGVGDAAKERAKKALSYE